MRAASQIHAFRLRLQGPGRPPSVSEPSLGLYIDEMEVVGVAVPVQSQRVPKSWNIPDTGPWHVRFYNLSEPLFSHLQSGDHGNVMTHIRAQHRWTGKVSTLKLLAPVPLGQR